jgi:hypothetical protein
MGLFRKHVIRSHWRVIWRHSWGVSATGSFNVDLTCFCLIHGVLFRKLALDQLNHLVCDLTASVKHCNTVETTVETLPRLPLQSGNQPWQPSWQLVTRFAPWRVRTYGANQKCELRCEPAQSCSRYTRRNAYQLCVPACVPTPCAPSRGSSSRTPGCVKSLREVLRETRTGNSARHPDYRDFAHFWLRDGGARNTARKHALRYLTRVIHGVDFTNGHLMVL